MIITTSNILLGRTPSVYIGLSTDLPENLTDPDFSTSYTSSDSSRLTLDFGSTGPINYVAFAGTNISGSKDFTSRARVRDGTKIIGTTFIERDGCILVTFPTQSFSNLRVGIYNSSSDKRPQAHFVAAGEYLTVPNSGEQSGYNRSFLQRNYKYKTQLNQQASPISQLKVKTSAKGVLNIPNATKDFSEGDWQDFLDFSVDNYFFVQEQQPIPEVIDGSANSVRNNSSYLCYDPKSTVKAHGSTRALNVISLSFKVFTGL